MAIPAIPKGERRVKEVKVGEWFRDTTWSGGSTSPYMLVNVGVGFALVSARNGNRYRSPGPIDAVFGATRGDFVRITPSQASELLAGNPMTGEGEPLVEDGVAADDALSNVKVGSYVRFGGRVGIVGHSAVELSNGSTIYYFAVHPVDGRGAIRIDELAVNDSNAGVGYMLSVNEARLTLGDHADTAEVLTPQEVAAHFAALAGGAFVDEDVSERLDAQKRHIAELQHKATERNAQIELLRAKSEKLAAESKAWRDRAEAGERYDIRLSPGQDVALLGGDFSQTRFYVPRGALLRVRVPGDANGNVPLGSVLCDNREPCEQGGDGVPQTICESGIVLTGDVDKSWDERGTTGGGEPSLRYFTNRPSCGYIYEWNPATYELHTIHVRSGSRQDSQLYRPETIKSLLDDPTGWVETDATGKPLAK